MPGDTVIDGAIDVFNNLCTAGTSDCNADDNFWRSLSNLTLNVDLPSVDTGVRAAGARCVRRGLRQQRRDVVGIPGRADPAGHHQRQRRLPGLLRQQQLREWRVHRRQHRSAAPSTSSATSSTWSATAPSAEPNGCPNGLWNMVYSGVQGAPAPVFSGQCQQNTVLPSSPVTEEEPFLYTDAQGNYDVFVPAVQHDSTGPVVGQRRPRRARRCRSAGSSLPHRTPPSRRSTARLALGKRPDPHPRRLQPRPADRRHPSRHGRPRLGFATLVPQHGNAAMIVAPEHRA